MKIVGYILLACLLLTLLQSLVIVASLVGLLALLWGACFRTRETFGLLLALLLFGLASKQPIPLMVVTGAVIVLLALTRRRDTPNGESEGKAIEPPTPPAPRRRRVWPAGGRDGAGDG